MPFDHAAAQAQAARILAHASGADGDAKRIRVRFGAQREIPAGFVVDRLTLASPHRGSGDPVAVLLTIASAALTVAPRKGQHFTDETSGATYSVLEDRSIPHGPACVFLCSVGKPVA